MAAVSSLFCGFLQIGGWNRQMQPYSGFVGLLHDVHLIKRALTHDEVVTAAANLLLIRIDARIRVCGTKQS